MKTAAILGVLVALSVAAFAVALWLVDEVLEGLGPQRTTWSAPTPPTGDELRQLRASVGAPTYWFGREAFGGALSTAERKVDPVRTQFVYGLHCEEHDPGSGLACRRAAEVSTSKRGAARGRQLTARPACWAPHGPVWVLQCGEPFRLFTADRVVEFFVPLPQDDLSSRPWREILPALRRFNDPSDGRFPPTDPFTCAELRRYPAAQRRAVPKVLRPARCG